MKKIITLIAIIVSVCVGCSIEKIPKGKEYHFIEGRFFKPKMVETFDIHPSKLDYFLYCLDKENCSDSLGFMKQCLVDALNIIIGYCEKDYGCEYDTVIFNPPCVNLYSKTGLIGYVYAVGIEDSKLVKSDLNLYQDFQPIDFKIGDTYFMYMKQMKDIYLFVPADYKETNRCILYDFHINWRKSYPYSEIINMNWTCNLRDVWKFQHNTNFNNQHPMQIKTIW